MPYYLRELSSTKKKRFILQLYLKPGETRMVIGRRIHRPLFQFGGISRSHAAFIKQSGDWYVEDLSSLNGTFINGLQLVPTLFAAPYPIRVHDKIGIGTDRTVCEEPTPLSICFELCDNLPSEEIGMIWNAQKSLKPIKPPVHVDPSFPENHGEDVPYGVGTMNAEQHERCMTYVPFTSKSGPPQINDFWTEISENPVYFTYNNQELKIKLLRCSAKSSSCGRKRPLRICRKKPLKTCRKEPLKTCRKKPLKTCKKPLKTCRKKPLKTCRKKPLKICRKRRIRCRQKKCITNLKKTPHVKEFWTGISENPEYLTYNNMELHIQLVRYTAKSSCGMKRSFEIRCKDKIECKRKKLCVETKFNPGSVKRTCKGKIRTITKKETFKINRKKTLQGRADKGLQKKECDIQSHENKIISSLDAKGEGEAKEALSVFKEASTLYLKCCKIQIGLLDMISVNKHLVVNLEEEGFTFGFPAIKASKNVVSITIKPTDIDHVEIFFDKISNLFLLISPSCVTRVENLLTTVDNKVHLFKDCQQFIIFHIINFAEEEKRNLIYYIRTKGMKMLVINQDRATECFKTYSNKMNIADVFEPPVTTVLTYTPHPMDGIALTTKDVACLNQGELLNDAIIDFYLKYVFYEKLSEQDRKRTHVFSTFFYSRLISGGIIPTLNDSESNKMCRHSVVKKWTKNLDLFSKDYVIIPINMKHHWFLVVICFPGKQFEMPKYSAVPDRNNDSGGNRKATAPTKNTKENVPVLFKYFDNNENDEEDKIENVKQQSPNGLEDTYQLKEMPCICIFDSVRGPSRDGILTTLRQYLDVEWEVKKKSIRTFDCHTMQGFLMLCPQQTNSTDCGIYLLQFMEHFFKNPLPYFGNPMPNLMTWFTVEEATKKRDEIKAVIEKLKEKFIKKQVNVKGNRQKADSCPSSSTLAEAQSVRPTMDRFLQD